MKDDRRENNESHQNYVHFIKDTDKNDRTTKNKLYQALGHDFIAGEMMKYLYVESNNGYLNTYGKK